MDTKLFHQFLEVARSGSFAAAARVQNIDPSAVSRAVSQLEAELGVRLFQRTTRSLALTEAGARFRSKIEGVVSEIEQICDEVGPRNTSPKGRLCVSASVAFGQACLVPLLGAFFERYPEIDLELKLTDTNVNLISERVDLAVRLAPTLDLDVVATKLMPTTYGVYASPAFVQSAKAPTTVADIATTDTLCFDLPDYRKRWIFRDSQGETSEVMLRPRAVISSALGVRGAALQGLGVALLPSWLVGSDIASGALIKLFPYYAVTATDFDTAAWLIYPSRSYLPHKTRLAIDFLRTHVARHLSGVR